MTVDGAVRSPDRGADRRGLLFGVAAYSLWGMLPLYFVALAPADPWEIVSLRVLFALVLCLLLLAVFGQLGRFLAAFTRPKALGLFVVAGLLIGTNWLLYTIAITTGHTLEASLGYFINPLVAIVLGVVVLRERLRALQWIAVGLGVLAVTVMAIFYGQIPWLSLGLALTFGFYGLTKAMLGGNWPALVALTMETLAIMPIAALIVGRLAADGALTLTGHGPLHTVLLVGAGVVTVVPLLLFGLAAARLPLSTVGMLQYIAPVLQFLIAVLFLHEAMPPERWFGFAIVWAAVITLIVDVYRTGRRRNRT